MRALCKLTGRLMSFGLGCLVLVIGVRGAIAQDVWGDEEVVIVTATRVPSLLSKTPASVSVITAEQIRKSNARTVADVVAVLPGMSIRPQGSIGALTLPTMRGTDPKHTLVLIDGIPINDQRQGTVDLNQIPVDNIERIEVVRGPASSLYGANALGGVINIITGTVKTRPVFQAASGSHGTRNYRFTALSPVAGGRFNLLMGKASSDGWRPNSDFSSWNGTARFEFSAAGWNDLSVSLVSYSDRKGTPGLISSPTLEDRQKSRNLLLRLGGERKINDNTDFTATVYTGRGKLEFSGVDWMGADYLNVHKTTSYGTQLQFNSRYDKMHTFLFGADLRREGADSTSLEKNPWATTLGLFVEDEIEYTDVDTFRIGARLDDHSDYGTQFNPRFGYIRRLSENSRLRATLGRAFRAPTFNELYWPFTDFGYGYYYQGNPDLKPEKAWTLDLGLEQRIGRNSAVKLTGFSTRVRDLITSGVTMPLNVGSAKMEGIELEFNHRLGKSTSFFANYTITSATDKDTGAALVRVPKNTTNIGLAYPFRNGANIVVQSRWVGRRWDYDFSSFPSEKVLLPTYNLLDVKLSWPLWSGINLAVIGENLLNRKYEAISGYPMPGRSLHLGLEYEM